MAKRAVQRPLREKATKHHICCNIEQPVAFNLNFRTTPSGRDAPDADDGRPERGQSAPGPTRSGGSWAGARPGQGKRQRGRGGKRPVRRRRKGCRGSARRVGDGGGNTGGGGVRGGGGDREVVCGEAQPGTWEILLDFSGWVGPGVIRLTPIASMGDVLR